VWTEARETIIAASSDNAKALERIQSAIIVVALDDSRPITREEISRSVWCSNGENRFFDKHQLIVFDNGRSGFNGEHSCMDGTPTSRLNDWMLKSLYAKKIDLGVAKPEEQLPQPTLITFKLDDASKKAIDQAKQHYNEELSKHKITVLQYNGYGKDV
jgi:carnitine O-acetyltransferase